MDAMDWLEMVKQLGFGAVAGLVTGYAILKSWVKRTEEKMALVDAHAAKIARLEESEAEMAKHDLPGRVKGLETLASEYAQRTEDALKRIEGTASDTATAVAAVASDVAYLKGKEDGRASVAERRRPRR